MAWSISTTNLCILAVGAALVALNVFASSRLAPGIAALFARWSSNQGDRGSRPA